MLSPEISARLEAAQTSERSYKPSREVASALGEKSLVMLVGPAAIGKSYIMNKMIELDPDFARVPVFTTREARADDDPGMFRCYPHTDEGLQGPLELIESHAAVQYAIHPTQGTIYGTELGDYPAHYNLLATLSKSVDTLEQLPFESTHVVGLTTSSVNWRTWFEERFPFGHPEREKRLAEAEQSLIWLLENDMENRIIWINNKIGHPEAAAKNIIKAVKSGKKNPDAGNVSQAYAMLNAAEDMAGAI